MGGYKRSVLVLEFEDPEFDGFEVRCKRMTVGQALDMDETRVRIESEGVDSENTRINTEKIIGYLVEGIISWNLLDENDQPVPVTQQALMSQDLGLVLTLANVWRKTATGVSVPLASDSASGDQSLAESLPMEAS